MADEIDEDTPMRTEENTSDAGSSDSEGGSGEEEVELMVTSRQKRSTAGNRLTSLLQQEEPDDELELLFAEDEEDAVYEDAGADSDVQMDSSDDDDDQGPTAGADDLDGEKELQRKEKAERLAKKRKMNDGIPKIFKKRVKIDPTVSDKPSPRPKKKSERSSWIPTPEDAPTRASARGTTRQSKEQLHAQMIDREKKRLKQLANMERAAAAKEAAKKPAMTQADRLAEAARVEKSNSKSLSRWEEAEQQREEEQRLKLAALHNRQLNGPVITLWSGLATWVGGKLKQIGSKKIGQDEAKEKTKKRKAAEMEGDDDGGEKEADAAPKDPSGVDSTKPGESSSDVQGDATANGGNSATSNSDEVPATKDASPPRPPVTNTATNSLLRPPAVPENLPQINSGIFKPPQLPTIPPSSSVLQPPNQTSGAVPPISGVLQPPQSHNQPVPINGNLQPPAHLLNASAPPFFLQPPSLDGSKPLPGFQPPNTQYPRLVPSQTTPFAFTPTQHYSPYTPAPAPASASSSAPTPPPPPPPPAPPVVEYSLRNCLILSNFDDDEIKSKDVQTRILFNQTFPKAPRTYKPRHSLCAITHYPAKFRDPKTGLPYLNAYAYKEIQKLRKGEYRWSALLGCYVGQQSFAARGVPSRFLKEGGGKVEGAGVGVGENAGGR
ncbi:yl1 nuclear protein [Rutstroemia sp. NJR-2017a BBW]|nr:yl1 nuclear protein [Rutstroemia sp. NJR-2017a BBW]